VAEGDGIALAVGTGLGLANGAVTATTGVVVGAEAVEGAVAAAHPASSRPTPPMMAAGHRLT